MYSSGSSLSLGTQPCEDSAVMQVPGTASQSNLASVPAPHPLNQRARSCNAFRALRRQVLHRLSSSWLFYIGDDNTFNELDNYIKCIYLSVMKCKNCDIDHVNICTNVRCSWFHWILLIKCCEHDHQILHKRFVYAAVIKKIIHKISVCLSFKVKLYNMYMYISIYIND